MLCIKKNHSRWKSSSLLVLDSLTIACREILELRKKMQDNKQGLAMLREEGQGGGAGEENIEAFRPTDVRSGSAYTSMYVCLYSTIVL